jgi:glycosyltransferase involved in cell wall biosynthesis
MRVLITGEALHGPRTGVQQYITQLVNALAATGRADLSILVTNEEEASAIDALVPRVVHPVGLSAGIVPWRSLPASALRGFDVIHCPTARRPFFGRPDAKLVMTILDLVPLVMPATHQWPYRVYFRHVLPRIVRRFDHVIAISEATRRDVIAYYGVDPSQVTAVPLASRWPALPRDEVLRTKEPFFLVLGTIEPRKNLKRVIEAFATLQTNDRLLIAGTPGWGSLDRNPAAPVRDRVEFLGFVDDAELRRLLSRARALVFASLMEGFGLPVLEAMVHGCPVITSDRSSMPEVGGDAVIYCDPTEVHSIADAMQRVSDPAVAARLIDAGFQRAALFSWSRCAEATLAVYARLRT